MSDDMSGGVPVLRARGLTLRYPGADAAVFQDVNLDLARGEVLAVLGASGPASPACCACWPGCRRPAPARSTWKASGWPACIRAWPWRFRIRASCPG